MARALGAIERYLENYAWLRNSAKSIRDMKQRDLKRTENIKPISKFKYESEE
jgi:hypothetical protein